MTRVLPAIALLMVACGGQNRLGGGGGGGVGGHVDDGGGVGGGGGEDGGQFGCTGSGNGCYTVYAHADHVLYKIDLQNKTLDTVGNFNAPMVNGKEDVITDLAVSPADDTIWVISNTNLYTADPNDGHVTLVGPVTSCGTSAVALSFSHDGELYAGDFQGAFCRIDPSAKPPTVTPVNMIGSGMALSGDLVAVADGTMYGTAYNKADKSGMGTQVNNVLVKIDPNTGAVAQQIGSTGYGKLFGVAFALGQVFGFTHDGSGDVITIDPQTGKGSLYKSFNDPSTGKGISFAGAGVNANVSPIQ
jgi:hypothetical protein